MKTDQELILMGLRAQRSQVIGSINKCLREWVEQSENTDLDVEDLNSLSQDVIKYRAELAEVDGRILKLTPVFCSDDIPF
jgi:hypothetical protein